MEKQYTKISFISGKDSEEVLLKLATESGALSENCFANRGEYSDEAVCDTLSESDAVLLRFRRFAEEANRRFLVGDDGPLFVCNFLERIDEAVDVGPILEELKATGRQVFIAVPQCYPIGKIHTKGEGV